MLRLHKNHPSRDGHPAMLHQRLHYRSTQAIFLQRLPPLATDPPMEISPHWGPALLEITEHPTRRPQSVTAVSSQSALLSDPAYALLPTVTTFSTLQWPVHQRCLLNRLSETATGRPIAHIQQQELSHSARRCCGNCKRTTTCNIGLLTCSSCHTPFHCTCSGPTRHAAAAALAKKDGLVDVAQRFRRNFGRDYCRPTGSSPIQPTKPASQPSMEC